MGKFFIPKPINNNAGQPVSPSNRSIPPAGDWAREEGLAGEGKKSLRRTCVANHHYKQVLLQQQQQQQQQQQRVYQCHNNSNSETFS